MNHTCRYSPAAKHHHTLAGTHFHSLRVGGWVGLLGLVKTEMAYPPKTVTHPSTKRARHQPHWYAKRCYHYATPPLACCKCFVRDVIFVSSFTCGYFHYFCCYRMNVFQENSVRIVPLRRKCVVIFWMLLARLQWTSVCQRVSYISIFLRLCFFFTVLHIECCSYRVLKLIVISFSESELTFTFAICCCPSICLSSVVCHPSSACLLSVTLVHPAQAVKIFRNISMAFGTFAIRWHPRKILRR